MEVAGATERGERAGGVRCAARRGGQRRTAAQLGTAHHHRGGLLQLPRGKVVKRTATCAVDPGGGVNDGGGGVRNLNLITRELISQVASMIDGDWPAIRRLLFLR